MMIVELCSGNWRLRNTQRQMSLPKTCTLLSATVICTTLQTVFLSKWHESYRLGHFDWSVIRTVLSVMWWKTE